jgi:hypothetical protein
MAKPLSAYHPQVEALEARCLPRVTQLIVDFTPDIGVFFHSNFRRHDFADTFGITGANGMSPLFLDFNGDGVVDTTTDPALAKQQILADVADYFRPFSRFNVSILGISPGASSGVGLADLNAGLASRSLQVFLLNVGGSDGDPATSGVYGVSIQANKGRNWEGFGHAFTDTIAYGLMQNNPSATPNDFAAFVASTIAHETGHMLGLGHPQPDYTHPNNVMDSSATGVGDRFLRRPVLAKVLINDRFVKEPQNAFTELKASFKGQPNEDTLPVMPGQPFLPKRRRPVGGHEHHHPNAKAALAVRDLVFAQGF